MDIDLNDSKMTVKTFFGFLLHAVVTGSTSGIGKAYAIEVSLQLTSATIPPNFQIGCIWSIFYFKFQIKRFRFNQCRALLFNKRETKPVCLFFQLARRGLDVVLVSRSNEKLQMVAKEIGGSNENIGVLLN